MTATAVLHGRPPGYNSGCRCEPCIAAWNTYQTNWRSERLASPDFVHGRRVSYLCGCRCVDCRASNAAYNMERKSRLRGTTNIPHGTVDGYGSYGCRCVACTQSKQADTRGYYVRNHAQFLERCSLRHELIVKDKRLVTPRDIARLLNRFDHRCAYCGCRADKLELDHVVPLSRGGRHSIGNLVPACVPCNRSKHAHLLVEWAGRP